MRGILKFSPILIFILSVALFAASSVALADDTLSPEENPGIITGATSTMNPTCPKMIAPGNLGDDFSKSKAPAQEQSQPSQPASGNAGESSK
jgi:hypothetical protein